MMVWKMIFLFQGCILRFHGNLPGCAPRKTHTKPEKGKIPKRNLLFQGFIFRLHVSFSRGVDNGPAFSLRKHTCRNSLQFTGISRVYRFQHDFHAFSGGPIVSPKLRLWMSFRMWISNSQERCWLQPPPGSLQRRAPVVLDPPSLRGSNQLGNGPTCHETPGNSQ